jgi:adenylosuccinate lyase
MNVADGIKVYPKVIERHILEELPFMATENIMMRAVKRGGNRQELHEAIRVHSVAAGNAVKELGLKNDLVDRIAGDKLFGLTKEEITAELEPSKYIGRAPEQVTEFIANCVAPVLEKYSSSLDGQSAELKV